jgi:peptide/nickel transport system permease protein
VAQGCFLVICAMVSVLNLLADILYGFIDPRITYARSKAVAET